MHNTLALNIYLLATGGLVIGLMGWVLADGLRTGKLPLRFGGMVHRKRQPGGFWFLAGLMGVVLCGVSFGYGTILMDLVWR